MNSSSSHRSHDSKSTDSGVYVEPGPLQPLVDSTLKLLCEVEASLARVGPADSFAAEPVFDRVGFKLWALGIKNLDVSLDQLLDEIPETREAMVGLLSRFLGLVLGAHFDCKFLRVKRTPGRFNGSG